MAPVSITLCLQLPTVASVRAPTLPPLSARHCVEWPVTAAPLCLQRSLTPLSTLIVDRRGYRWDAGARLLCGAPVLLKSHAAAVTHFPPNAGAPARHSGVNSVRTGSADAGKTIVSCLLLSDTLARLHSAYFFARVMHYFFWGGVGVGG